MRVVIGLLLLLLPVWQEASGFAPLSQPRRIFSISSSDKNENQQPSPKQTQERILEQLSREGASQIASLDVHERAKRAMLAEAIEDRIMDNIEVLEHLVAQTESSCRAKAVELARETKTLQVQYEELVTGKPSSVLQSLEAVMGNSSKDGVEEEE